jgi:hypothetical protein
MVHTASDGHEARGLRIAHEMHGLARYGKAALDLRTNRHPFYVVAEGIGEKMVKLVPAVVADLFSEEARADAKFDFVH